MKSRIVKKVLKNYYCLGHIRYRIGVVHTAIRKALRSDPHKVRFFDDCLFKSLARNLKNIPPEWLAEESGDDEEYTT